MLEFKKKEVMKRMYRWKDNFWKKAKMLCCKPPKNVHNNEISLTSTATRLVDRLH